MRRRLAGLGAECPAQFPYHVVTPWGAEGCSDKTQEEAYPEAFAEFVQTPYTTTLPASYAYNPYTGVVEKQSALQQDVYEDFASGHADPYDPAYMQGCADEAQRQGRARGLDLWCFVQAGVEIPGGRKPFTAQCRLPNSPESFDACALLLPGGFETMMFDYQYSIGVPQGEQKLIALPSPSAVPYVDTVNAVPTVRAAVSSPPPLPAAAQPMEPIPATAGASSGASVAQAADAAEPAIAAPAGILEAIQSMGSVGGVPVWVLGAAAAALLLMGGRR